MKAWKGQVLKKKQKKNNNYLSDITNIARHNHLLWVDILIKAALIIFSIWILVDNTKNSD